MWIFTNNGMVSIVQKPGDTEYLTVRARVKGDIERVFPGAKTQAGGGTDYAYRAKIHRNTVAQVIHDQIMGIEYDNFKNSIKDHDHHDHCAGVWSVGYRHQARMAPKPRGKGGQRELTGY
jgi:hypothetical protein